MSLVFHTTGKTGIKAMWNKTKVVILSHLILHNKDHKNVSDTIQKWIAIIETTGHESSCKQFCTIQIKVTANMPQIPHIVKAWATDCWYMWEEGEIFTKYYTKIPSRFSRVSFDTQKLNRKHREVFAPLLFIPNKEEFSFIWVQFSLFIDIHDWTEAIHDCEPFSAAEESPDTKETYSWL